MLNVLEKVNLAPYNTFGITEFARWFVHITTPSQISELIHHPLFTGHPYLILGGGSNILFTRPFEGLVIHTQLKGIETIDENHESVWLKVAAGENWHQLVMYCVHKGYGGIENLSLIPGTAGAAPVQNIGAYGVELADVLHEVEGYHLPDGSRHILPATACRLSYRDSVFKQEWKGKFFISSITLRLTRHHHRLHTSYPALADMLKHMQVTQPTPRDISEAVIRIRSAKLPDPAVVGNAGSFFKNPVVPLQQYRQLQERYPDIPGYIIDNQHVKIPAAWLIEQCGWKGRRIGQAGVHHLQALVLVNYGGASGAEIIALATNIQSSVAERFEIELQPEVNIV
jgi:UDP-N-acetylmuramate dehydrogenase